MRLDDLTTADPDAIRREVLRGNTVVVQYNVASYTPESLADLNALCAELSANLCIRFFGHYSAPFDCANLQYLPAVKNLELSGMTSVENIDAVKRLQHLERLYLGIFELDNPDLLAWDNLRGITELALPSTRKNNINLSYLCGYRKLARLFLGGHTSHLSTLGRIGQLSDLSLNLPSTVSVAFLNALPNLRSLRFILGGRANLDEIACFTLERLEIVRVKGFSSFSNLHKFVHLRELIIEDQLQLRTLDFGGDLTCLKDIRLMNCKNLGTAVGLAKLPALASLRIGWTAINFTDLVEQALPASLETFAFYTASKREDREIKERLTQLGYVDEGGL